MPATRVFGSAAALLVSSALGCAHGSAPKGNFEKWPAEDTPEKAAAASQAAEIPVVVAIRYLAQSEAEVGNWDSVWQYTRACQEGNLRPDLAATMVRASTLLAGAQVRALVNSMLRGDFLRKNADHPEWFKNDSWGYQYAGPLRIILEPVKLNSKGEMILPSRLVDPHIRVFVTASVAPCQSKSNGAFGTKLEITPRIAITVHPAFGLGIRSFQYSPWPLAVATLNSFREGFCCGPAGSAFSALTGPPGDKPPQLYYDTVRDLLTTATRSADWSTQTGKYLDLFPSDIPSGEQGASRSIKFNSGRIGSLGLIVLPSRAEDLETRTSGTGSAARPELVLPTYDDFILGIARAISKNLNAFGPSVVAAYDSSKPSPAALAKANDGSLRVEVALDLWKEEVEFVERTKTVPFMKYWREDGPFGSAAISIVQSDEKARSSQTFAWITAAITVAGAGALTATNNMALSQQALAAGAGVALTAGQAEMAATTASDSVSTALQTHMIKVGGREVSISAGNLEEFHGQLVQVYGAMFPEERPTPPKVASEKSKGRSKNSKAKEKKPQANTGGPR